MAEEGKINKDIASLLGVDVSDTTATEAWEVKAETVRQERIEDIRHTLEAIGLTGSDADTFMIDDAPEQWEVKIEKEKEQLQSEIRNIRKSLGISPDDPAMEEVREAWEIKVDKEHETEAAVNVENPVQEPRAGSIRVENPVRLSLKLGDGDIAAVAAAEAASSTATAPAEQEDGATNAVKAT